ncbi:type II toxin-antitoxin system HicB family antitoxin [Desulforudis sp. DRI-14]|uniref:type II toxin-antitoxin system HicB family antitoxin n=1 Tax=Desulforudis sp. DRI-14 TaxID=3459793 RepID=UPI004042416C
MRQYLVIVERADGNYSAYSPDLPGCVATGRTVDEAKNNMAVAMRMHIEGLIEDGIPLPEPSTTVDYIPVNA